MKMEPIGVVKKIDQATSSIELRRVHTEGLAGINPGDRLDILYWMHELAAEKRCALQVHPMGDASRPKRGVFALRSPMRPNPIGVSQVYVTEIRGNCLVLKGLDAHDGSPVIDIKAARRADDAAARLVSMWGQVHHEMVSALRAALGEAEVERILRTPMQRAGCSAASERLNNASEIGRAILAVESLWDIEGSILEDSPIRFTRQVTACPWSFFTPLGCDIFAWWMEGFVRGCNDRYNYQLERSMPRGDDVCIWSVREKSGEG